MTPTKVTSGPKKVVEIVLKVAEAGAKDVGRGIARIDPEDMSRLGATVGDVIAIRGKRTTVAKVMPTFQAERGKGLIQADGLLRANCQAGLDEKVSLSKVEARPAERIVLLPGEELTSMTAKGDTKYLGRLLEEIGDYDAARAAVADVQTIDEQLSALLNRLRRRL